MIWYVYDLRNGKWLIRIVLYNKSSSISEFPIDISGYTGTVQDKAITQYNVSNNQFTSKIQINGIDEIAYYAGSVSALAADSTDLPQELCSVNQQRK